MKPERLTPLTGEFVDDHGARPVWMLLAPLEYYSALLDERVEVPAGFKTDFASVPRLIAAYAVFLGDLGELLPAAEHTFTRQLLDYYVGSVLRGDPQAIAARCAG